MPDIASQKDIIQGPPTFFKPMFLVNVSPQRLEMCHLSNIYSDAIWLLNYLRFSRTNMDSELNEINPNFFGDCDLRAKRKTKDLNIKRVQQRHNVFRTSKEFMEELKKYEGCVRQEK